MRLFAESHGWGKLVPKKMYPKEKQQIIEKVFDNLGNLTTSLSNIIAAELILRKTYHTYIDKAFNGADYSGYPMRVYEQYNEFITQLTSECTIFKKLTELKGRTETVASELKVSYLYASAMTKNKNTNRKEEKDATTECDYKDESNMSETITIENVVNLFEITRKQANAVIDCLGEV
jgi:hypothetical protein